MSPVRLLQVPDGLAGLRLDVAMARLFGLSRTAAADLIDAGDVQLDGAISARSVKVDPGAWLEVALPDPPVPNTDTPDPVEGLSVLYDDSDIIVIDKPVGVAAHSGPGWVGPTVLQGIAALGHRITFHGPPERQGIVHRLDAATTGIMVVAKSERAYSALKRAFKAREVDKRYSALVQGHPDPSRGTVDAPIGRHPSSDWKFAVMADGRPSVTHYETVEAFRSASLLDIGLETGRTHQIRVHMSAIKHPCAGDLMYGADPVLARRLGLERQWLHARELSFIHPGSGQRVTFTSEFPADLRHALAVVAAG
jgi:23S rRNA pseudouridine1911/1915/1917 synthase